MGSTLSKGTPKEEKEIRQPDKQQETSNIPQNDPAGTAFIQQDQGSATHGSPVRAAKAIPLPYDIALILQSGLDKDETGEGSSALPASRQTSITEAHAKTVDGAVHELKEKYSMNAQNESNIQANSELETLRKEIDAYDNTALDRKAKGKAASAYVWLPYPMSDMAILSDMPIYLNTSAISTI